jgi:hypothetical protein
MIAQSVLECKSILAKKYIDPYVFGCYDKENLEKRWLFGSRFF